MLKVNSRRLLLLNTISKAPKRSHNNGFKNTYGMKLNYTREPGELYPCLLDFKSHHNCLQKAEARHVMVYCKIANNNRLED